MDSSLYTRPNKPATMIVQHRKSIDAPNLETLPAPIEVSGSTECHVTPSDVAETMASYLEPEPHHRILEPHVGTGNLVQALIDYGYGVDKLIAVERNYELCRLVGDQFDITEPLCECFLEYAETTADRFDRIIMNPPFKRIKKHMDAAINLLTNDGLIVALVPISYDHPKAVLIDTLGSGTFALAKVNTKIITINRDNHE